MGQPHELSVAVLVCLTVFYVVVVSAGKCTTGCHGMHTSKAYQEGHTYVYNLNGLSVTSVTDAQGDATLKLSATVELSVKSNCLHQLRLKNVQLNGAPPSTPDVEQYAVQFNYHNGHIDTELCTEPGDSQASLNIKRAVVSMFQSAIMQDGGTTTHHETDVMGACPTDFSFRKEGDSLIVHKNRNLAECAFRENVNQGLISASIDTTAGIKSAPLLASHQEIEQRFKRGILHKAMTTEAYQLRPFSNGNSGAKTVVETTLTLKSEKSDSPTAAVSQPKSLIFEAPHPVLKSSVSAINNALKAAKAQVTDGVRPEAASNFMDLVKVVRLSTKNDILSVYQKIRHKDERKLLLDAVCLAGSGEAAEVAVELIKNKEVTGVQALFFYTSLALVRHVNLPSVVAVTSLLDQPNVPQNFRAYLGIGHVIGKYCQDHPCENVPEVKVAVHKIREKVGNGKAKTREDENRVIFALKALGNTQFLDDATLQKLANIGADKNVRTRVRVAALEALPTRCSIKWKNILFKVLADREEDSEVRIKSYLSLVACPCHHVAEQLKEVLSKETVNQVGSFIQSHLRNLRASTDPNKQDAKNHLGLIKPRAKFPEDIRKFSFNNELSYSANALGLGSTLESNVIYSQNSFVPRSTNLNLTVELFGRSFNFLDLTARVENLDRVIEHYFGPKGKVWKSELGDIMGTNTSTVNKIGKYIEDRYEKSIRGKREVKQVDLDKFAKNVHLRDNEVDENLDLDLSMKLFGVELALLSYQGNSNKLNPEAVIDQIFDNIDKGFDMIKNLNYDFENYLQFLEAELVYPTSLGSALTLGLTGTSAVRIKTNAKLDIPAILKNPKNAAIKIALEPSVSISVVGNMIVQGLGAESGMKIVSTLHTATSTDVSVNVLDGKGIDVNIGIPKKKQELISLSSEVLLSTGPNENKYVAPNFRKSKEYKDCFQQFSTILGLKVCGEISYPYEDLAIVQKKPMFPLSGPAKLAVVVENDDVSSYYFKIYLNTQDPKKRTFEVLFDTLNSKTNRRVSLIAEAGLEPNKYAKISFDSPIKKVSAEAVLKNTPQERTVTIKANHDQIEYYGRIGMLASGNKYTPVLEYKVPEHTEKLASAKTGLKLGQQFNMQGTVDVTDENGGQKFVFDKVALVGTNGQKLFVVDGFFIWTPNTLTVDTNIDYTDKNLVFKMDGKVTDNNYALTVSAIPSVDPNIAFKLEWEFKREVGASLENKLVFTHGSDINSKLNRFQLEQKVNYNLVPENFLLSTSNELTYPAVNLELKLDGKLTRKSISGDIEMKYETFKFGTELSAKTNIKKPGDYEIEVETELMNNSIKLKAKRTVLADYESKYTNSLVLSPGGKYDADATLTYNVSKNKVNIQLDGDLNLDGKKVKVDTGLVADQQSVNSRMFIKIDSVKYIEFVLNIRNSPNPVGSLNLNLKKYLTAIGQYNYQNGKGTATLNIDVPKINRKIKATGDLAISGSEHVGNFEILYDAEKDPSKRIKLSTISDITKTSIDTKNVLEVRDCKVELNGKGSLKGTFADGQLEMNVDLTLPNKRYLVYKLQRNSVKKDNKYDIQLDTEFTDSVTKGGESQKITYSTNAKNIDPQLLTFQINSQLKYVSFDGKDIQIGWDGENLKQNDRKRANYNVTLSGAKIPNKFQLHVGWDLGEKQGTGTVKSSLGDNLSLEGKTNFVLQNDPDKPDEVDGVLDLVLPSDRLRNMKLESKNLLGRSECKHTLKITYNDDKTIKMETNLKTNEPNDLESGRTGKLTLNVLQYPPLIVEGTYKYTLAEEKNTASVDLNLNYSNMKLVLQCNTEDLPNLAVANINAEYNLNFEKLRKIDVQFVNKIHKHENRWETNTVVLADDVKYTLKSEIQQQDASSLLHIEATYPSGKTEILSKVQKLGPKEYKGEWNVTIPTIFVALDAHVNLISIDDFVVNANFDSSRYRNIHIEIANKLTAKTGKRIIITVTRDGQNVVTGSMNYKKRDEDGKIVVEGNGSVKIHNNTRSSSFKYTRQELTHDKDGEVGVAMILNANFGPSAIVGELKVSNKEIHVFESYCEQAKDCTHFEVQSILDTEQTNMLKHQITVEVAMNTFNIPAEFGLKISTVINATTFDHVTNLYLHSKKDKSEYTYQVYVHPKEAATILTLPSREMAVILTYDLPKTKNTGAYKLDLSVYLDRKNKPSDKTSLTTSGDINIDQNSLSFNGETKFIYPKQPKEMIMKGRLHYGDEHLLDLNLNIDVFAKKSQKITILANLQRQKLPNGNNITGVIALNSHNQQLKLDLKSHLMVSHEALNFSSFFTYNDVRQKLKTLGVYLSADVNHYTLLATLPDKELIKDELRMEFSKDLKKVQRELSLLGETPEMTTFESDMNGFKFLKYPKNNPNNKLSVNGKIDRNQLAEVRADTYQDGAKQELFHVLIHLDEKQFLKPEFGYNEENVAKALDDVKNKNIELVKKLKDVQEYVMDEVQVEFKDLLEQLKKTLPNMKPLLDYYQAELNKLKVEISDDKTVKEIQATLNKYLGTVIKAVIQAMKEIAEGLEKLQKQVNEILLTLKTDMKDICTRLKESYDKIFHELVEILDAMINLANTFLNAALNMINKHQKELQDFMNVISDVTQDIASVLSNMLKHIKRSVEEFNKLLVDQLKVPQVLKEKIEQFTGQFQVSETIVGPIEELCNAVQNVLPTEELRQYLNFTCQYIVRHAKHEKINEEVEIKKMYSHAVSAIQSIVSLLQKQTIHWENLLDFVQVPSYIDFSILSKLPGISSLRISVLNLLRKGELATPLDLYYTYRPTLYLSDIVPPFSKSAVVTDGGHFFTFDGRHMTLPGTCTYILAQDMQDGNFSVVANFNNGALISVTITEPKDNITLKNNGNILVHNKPADFPANTKNLHAYLYQLFTNVKSDYGVRVTCSKNAPMICSVHVSGFYMGKLRGLFGDGNNEPYDDYTLPSGKITESATEFGNAYKLKGNCAAATAVEHKDRAPVCTKYFSGQATPLGSCFNYVNPTQYRDACDHAVAANTEDGACLIATAYHYTCYSAGIKSTHVPPSCSKCISGANTVDIGDSFSVKVPKKEADIIFVVEQETPNEKIFKEMVTPLMSELRDELKHHEMTDVHIGLIGFSEKMKWPQHYTLNGNTNINGEVKTMKFHEKKPTVTFEEATTGNTEKKLSYLRQRLDVELGTIKLNDAYEEAIRYPFRPGAATAVIGVLANPCEKSPLLLSLQQIKLLLGQKTYRDLGLTYYHMSFPNELLVSGKPQKNIVGYDQDNVYTFADSKKKPLSGCNDMKSNLVATTTDVCADFALSSSGATFSLDNFLNAKPNQKKQFIQVAARRIADGLANLVLEKDCSCDFQFGIAGRSQCKIVDRREKEPLVRHTKGGVKG